MSTATRQNIFAWIAFVAFTSCGGGPQAATSIYTDDASLPPSPNDIAAALDLIIPSDDSSDDDSAIDSRGSELPDDFGQPCNQNTDCDSNLCISGPDGDLCSVPCVETCPEDYECKGVTSTGPDLTFACVPLGLGACQPCDNDTDCAGGLCIQFGDGRACSKPCNDTSDCLDGLACASPPEDSAAKETICSPKFNSCKCFLDPETCDCTPGTPCQPSQACATGETTCELGVPECVTIGPKPDSDVCRPSAGICDVAENCDGMSLDCPPNVFESTSFICREPAAPCDAPELCAGDTAACPEDSKLPAGSACDGGSCSQAGTCVDGCVQDAPCDFGASCELGKIDCSSGEAKCVSAGPAPAGTICRDTAGACDAVEVCNGTTLTCPEDVFALASEVCRPSTSICDIAELCTGSAVDCPDDQWADSSTICRESKGACDIAESCSGDTTGCPPDAVLPAATVCRPAVGSCDAPESCDGTSDQCPVDTFSSPDTVCRASGGACDPPEKCSGSSADCPIDILLGTDSVCRPQAGLCDSPENCTGVSAQCPPDGFQFAGTVCRQGNGACDPDELCSGTSSSCPADTPAPIGTPCSGGSCNGLGLCIEGCIQDAPCNTGNACEIGTIDCSGGLPQCVGQGPAQLGTVCRSAQGACDQEEACDGIGLTCPPDVFSANDVVCRVASGSCDVAETCPGNGPNCPGDIFLGGDTICRPANGICDPSESCAGTSPNCPADTFAAASTLCAPATSECQTAGTCDGLGLCQGVANIADGTACGSSENSVCTAPDTCFNGTCAPNHADAGILCGAPVGACQNAGVCSASGVCLPATNAANGTACGDSAQTDCTAPDTCTSGTCIDNHSPSGTPCDDGDPTTAGDKCNGNGGCIGTTLECPAPSMCTPDFTPNGQTCVPTHAPSGTTCNDDDNTTANDQCDGVGTCVGTDINCPTPSLCTPAYTPNGTGCTPTHAPAGTGCNDGDETTKNDICDGDGFCFGITIQCPIPSGCIVAYDTDGSGCIPIFATTGTVCDDQNNGTKDDQCTANGQCVGTAYSCPIGDLCTPSYTQDGVGCIANFSPEGTQCGSASTQCKHPEACDGAGSCLPETNVTNGTACGDQSNTACTNPDTCQTGICRSNHANSGVVCGTASDECKSPGVCDGSGVCGSQTNVPNGTACGDASDSLCTNPDSCLNGVCLSNHEPQGTTCGTASSECKQPETCNGAGVCGSETNLANGTPCGDQTNTTCDKADSCLDGTCASNFAPINTTCGTASGECKFAEVCNAAGKCQPETNKPTGTACGSQADTVCSDPDFCKDGLCQKNHEAAGTLCGTASGDCKNAETCNSDGACQNETNKADGSACGSQQTTSCTSADTCLSGVCQTNHKPAGTPCGTASNECKNSELCDSSGTCLPETNKPAGTACGSQSNTACTNPDTCASGKCQSNHAADGTVCGSGTANKNCQISVCSTGSCSGNQTAANGTECSYSIQSTGATICGTCSSNQSSSNVSCMPGNKNAFCQPTGLGPFCVVNSTELILHCLPCPSGYSVCAIGGPGPIPF